MTTKSFQYNRLWLLILGIALSYSLHAAAPSTITNANKANNGIADLSSCFGTDNSALFDYVYVLGRTWRERQTRNKFIAVGNISDMSVEEFEAIPETQKEGITSSMEYAPDEDGCWIVSAYKDYILRKHSYTEIRTFSRSGGTGFLDKILCATASYTTRASDYKESWEYTTYRVPTGGTIPTKPDDDVDQAKYYQASVTHNGTTYATIACNGSHQVELQDYVKYDWVTAQSSTATGYATPKVAASGETVIGVLVKRQNLLEHNVVTYSGQPCGEPKPDNAAIERVVNGSANNKVVIDGELGAYNERNGIWVRDEVCDRQFFDGLADDEKYTVLTWAENTNQRYNLNTVLNCSDMKAKVNGIYYWQAALANHNGLYDDSGTTPKWNASGSVTTTLDHTVCYVYKKNGSQYNLQRTFDAQAEPIGVLEAGKKHYITGRCISFLQRNNATPIYSGTFIGGSANVGDEGPGFMVARGDLHIYLENCELESRTPNDPGDEFVDALSIVAGEGKKKKSKISSPIVLEEDGTDVTIHIKGKNFLKGNYGRNYNAGNQASGAMHGAAIYINSGTHGWGSNDQLTLTLTDTWPTTSSTTARSNGYLKLEAEQDGGWNQTTPNRQAAPLYIGNNDCKIIFDGGQYRFVPGDSNASGQKSKMIVENKSKTVSGVTVTNLGEGAGVGTVWIKGGTFSMMPMFANKDVLYSADGYEMTNYLMNFPTNTFIDGGTFNGAFPRSTASTSEAPSCPYNSRNQAGTTKDKQVFDYKIYGTWDGSKFNMEEDSKPSTGEEYTYYNTVGANPLLHGLDEYITAMLPSSSRSCAVAELTQWWDFGFPSGVNDLITAQNRKLYQNIKKAAGKNYTSTKYFAMMEMNPYYPTPTNYTKSNITETEDYAISGNVYLMTWIMADKWRVFTAPFDVQNIYLLETWAVDNNGDFYWNEDEDGNRTTQLTAEDEYEYYIYAAQTMAMNRSLDDLANSPGVNATFGQIWSTAVSSTKAKADESNLLRPARPAAPIKYYNQDGNNNSGAFYLYEAKGTNGDGVAHGQGSNFGDVWQVVPKASNGGYIMKKGHVYAMMFPNWTTEGNPGYNYWNGKYIYLEGPAQTLTGTTTGNSATITTPTTDNEFQFGGNPTFNNTYRPSQTKYYVWDFENQEFTQENRATMSWLSAYVAANNTTLTNVKKIGRKGNVANTTDIKNGAKEPVITAYGVDNGIAVQSLAEQHVTIYNVQGIIIYDTKMSKGENIVIPTQPGVYIIRSNATIEIIKIISK